MLFRVLAAAVAALLVARLLVPTESAAQGATLWLVQLWLAGGLLWLWNCVRERDFHIRLDGCDLALWVIIAGHLAATVVVLFGGGQKRAAINLSWEWVGLGVGFFLIRQTVRTPADARRVVLAMLLTAVSLSGLGLWQHYVFYPQTAREYELQREELDRLIQSPPSADAREESRRLNRMRELTREFARQEIPLEGRGRRLWEQRLRASTEPFGLFALANSFAGLLVVWLVVWLTMLFDDWRAKGSRRQMYRRAASLLLMLVIAFCLLLTKSRTSWVGACAGLSIWGWLRYRRQSLPTRGAWVWGLLGGLLLVALATLAFMGGSLDVEVLSEAGDSLRYRLQYWQASSAVIRENPWFGAGPGNFRQHYLKHKLPESSEEIADPHNFALDLWANGGLIAVVGLALMAVVAIWTFRRVAVQEASAGQTGQPGMRDDVGLRHPLLVGAGLSFLLVFAFEFFFGSGTDYRLLVLFAGWVGLVTCFGQVIAAADVSPDHLAAGGVALMVHLLGAGGIEMPAISQTLLLILAVASVLPPPTDSLPGMRESRGWAVFFGGAMPVLFVACLLTATVPVLNRRALVAAGDFAWREQGNDLRAQALYRRAVKYDPFSPQPAQRLAELEFQRWQMSAGSSDSRFQQVVHHSQRAIAQDPAAATGYWRLGQRYLARFQRTKDQVDAAAASEWLARAVRRYPHQAALRAELADTLAKAGGRQRAREETRQALWLNQINRREGHTDKYLQPEVLQRLEEILNARPQPTPRKKSD